MEGSMVKGQSCQLSTVTCQLSTAESLNVSIATAIILSEFRRRWPSPASMVFAPPSVPPFRGGQKPLKGGWRVWEKKLSFVLVIQILFIPLHPEVCERN